MRRPLRTGLIGQDPRKTSTQRAGVHAFWGSPRADESSAEAPRRRPPERVRWGNAAGRRHISVE
jgi:hypothetical protein